MIARTIQPAIRCLMALVVTLFMLPVALADQPGADDPRVKLLEAVMADDASVVQELLVAGVNPNIKEVDRGPAVVMAATERSYKALKQLIAAPHTNLEATNDRGATALMVVAAQGRIEVVRALLDRGARVNAEDRGGPLHAAARAGHADVVEVLIEQDAAINAVDEAGRTPMILAARFGQFSAYEAIVKAGADPTIRDKENQSAADYLQARGEVDRARLLRNYMKKFEAGKG